MGFIDEHGLVKYKQGKYKATGSCEVPGCAEYQAALAEYYRQLMSRSKIQHTPHELVMADGTRYVENERGHMAKDGRIRVVIDHCHKHGWIRGVACNSCNTAIGHIENRTGPAIRYPGIKLPDYASFIRKCPDCVQEEPTATPATEPASHHQPSPPPPAGTIEPVT